MFRKLSNAGGPIGGLTVFIDNQPVEAEEGETVAGVLLRLSNPIARTTPVNGSPRAPFCMMGVCFECLAIVDGMASTQTCLVTVKDGMRIERQHGRREAALGEQSKECRAQCSMHGAIDKGARA